MENTQTPVTTNNDWFAVNLHMPDATQADLKANSIDSDNTTLKDKDFYKSKESVQKMFTNENTGNFDEDSYNKYYDSLVYSYNQFDNKNQTENAINEFEYHPYNGFAPEDAKVKTDLYKVTKIANPFRQLKGIDGFNKVSSPEYSIRELAQMNNVYDSKTGKKLDWTPNDDKHTGLWDFWKNPTLVVAQWDEDGEHYDALKGRMVKHKAGESKTDDKGFFYETLGDREAYNRQVLSWADTLTKEGTWANDYDFMDSDGLDKSIAGVVAKTALKIAPMIIPGVGQYYGLALVGTELLNVVPMVAKAGIGLFAGDSETNKEYWKRLNRIQGFSKTLSTSGVSDYAANDIVNTENFGQLLVDVVGQLTGQRAIASIPSMIGMSNKNIAGASAVYERFGVTVGDKMRAGSLSAIEKAQIIDHIPEAAGYINRTVQNIKVAKAMATTYMAAISAAGITEESKKLGLDERDTAALYIGVTLGFLGMMRYVPIGEWAMNGIGLEGEGKIVSQTIKKNFANLVKSNEQLIADATPGVVATGTKEATAKGASSIGKSAIAWNQKLINKGKELGGIILERLKDGKGYTGGMLSESAEEVSEEAMQDAGRVLYNGMTEMGLTSTRDKNKEFKYNDLNAIIARYGMAGFGGAVGGAVFHFGNNVGNNLGVDGKDAELEEVLIRNHQLPAMLKEVDKWEDKGIASKTLSFETAEVVLGNGSKKTVFKPATSYELSQNAIMANVMRERYNKIQDQIFQEGVLSNVELAAIYDDRMDALVKTSANSPLIEDYTKITGNILRLRKELNEVTTVNATAPASEQAMAAQAEAAKKINSQLAVEREKLAEIHNGDKFVDYQKFALFAINSGVTINNDPDSDIDPDTGENLNPFKVISISDPFVNLSINEYSMNTTNKPYAKLTPSEKDTVKKEWEAFKKLEVKDKLKEGFKRFTYLNEQASLSAQEILTLATALRESMTYKLSTSLLKPTKATVSGLDVEKESLNNNKYISPSINKALNVSELKDEHTVIANKMAALNDIIDILNSSEKITSDVVSDFKKIVNGFTISNVIGAALTSDVTTRLVTEVMENEDGEEEEIEGSETIPLDSINDQFSDNTASHNLKEELNKAKLTDLEKIYSKYENMINSSKASDEVRNKDLKNLKEIFDNIYTRDIMAPYLAEVDSLEVAGQSDPEILQKAIESRTFMDAMLRNFPDKSVAGFIKVQESLDKALDNKSLNTVKELLNKFDMIKNGKVTSLIELLAEEFENIAQQESITEYQINDPEILNNLKEATLLIAQLKSIIMASTEYVQTTGDTFGYNSTLNKSFPDILLGVVDQGASIMVIGELDKIGQKIQFLTELAKINGEDKLKNSRDAGLVMESLFYEQLMDGKGLRSYMDEVKIHGEPLMNEAIKNAILEANAVKDVLESVRNSGSRTPLPSTEAKLVEYETQVMAIQMAIHNRVKELINRGEGTLAERSSSILKQFYEVKDGKMSDRAKKIFPPMALSHPSSTSFSSTERTVQPLDLFIWLNTTIAVNSAEFVNELRGKQSGDTTSGIRSSAYAPFYSQEYSAKVVFGMVSNNTWVKEATKLISNDEAFLPKLIKVFTHGVFIDGVAGSGKSTAVTQALARMLTERGINFWVSAPYKHQADKLNKDFKGSAAASMDKDALLLAILNNNADILREVRKEENLEELKERLIYEKSRNKAEADLKFREDYAEFGFYNLNEATQKLIDEKSPNKVAGLPPVIFIDEITHFSAAELTAINIALSKMTNPPLLVMMGDTRQNGFQHNGERHNVNLFHMWRTPKLSNSLRNSNNLKRKNSDAISSFYRELEELYLESDLLPTSVQGVDHDPYQRITEVITEKSKSSLTRLRMFYHENSNGKIFGEKIINPSELSIGLVKKMSSNLSTDTKMICFITNNKNSEFVKELQADPDLKGKIIIGKAETDPDGKVNVLFEDEVQGLEFESVIVDVDWSNYRANADFAPMNTIANLNTLTSRSEVGTVIVDNSLRNYEVFKLAEEQSESVYETQLDPTLVSEFKTTRANVIDALVNAFKTDIPAVSSFSSLTTNDGKSAATAEVSVAVTDNADLNFLLELQKQNEIVEKISQGDTEAGITTSNSSMQGSNLLAYPWYNRRGAKVNGTTLVSEIDNEDAGYLSKKFPGLTIEAYDQKLMSIKTAILYNQDRVKKLSKILSGDKNLQIDKAKLVVRGSRFKLSRDKTFTSNFDTKKSLQDGDIFLRIALEIPTKSGNPVYITIAPLAKAATVAKINNTGLAKQLHAIEENVKIAVPSATDYDTSFNFEITDPNFINNMVPSTNLQMHKLENNEIITYDKFKAEHAGALISAPYIITGYAPIALAKTTSGLDKRFMDWIKGEKGSDREGKLSLAGKACCYVTYDPTLTDASKLEEVFDEERITALKLKGEGKVPPIPRVKLIMLDLKAYEPQEWFKKTMVAFRSKMDDKAKDAGKVENPIGIVSAPAMAGRVYSAFVNIYESTKEESDPMSPDGMVHAYTKEILTRVSKMFKYQDSLKIDENIDPIIAETVKIFEDVDGKGVINTYLGNKAEFVEHYPQNGKYSPFKYNHVYKLLLGLNIAILGGHTTVATGKFNTDRTAERIPIEFVPIEDALGITADVDVFSMIMGRFNSYMKENGFPKGIYTSAVYQQGYLSKKTKVDPLKTAAEPALQLSEFTVGVRVSLPNILLDLGTVKTPFQITEEISQAYESRAQAVINEVTATEQALETITGVVGDKDAVLTSLISRLEEVLKGIETYDKDSFSSKEDLDNFFNKLLTHLSAVRKDTDAYLKKITVAPEPSKTSTVDHIATLRALHVANGLEWHKGLLGGIDVDPNTFAWTFQAVGEKSAKVTYATSSGNTEFLLEINDSFPSGYSLTTTKVQIINPIVPEEEVVTKIQALSSKIAAFSSKPIFVKATTAYAATYGQELNIALLVDVLKTSTKEELVTYLTKYPGYLSIFTALGQDGKEILTDFREILNNKDSSCIN